MEQTELLALTEALAQIPAPSGEEDKRAEFCRRWLAKNGVSAGIDEVGNVIVELGSKDAPAVLFLAHTDIVFDSSVPLVPRREGEKLFCPGIWDDTVHVAFLLFCARYMTKQALPDGLRFVFAADVGEEGQGNLRGCRALMERYGGSLREVIAFDSNQQTVNTGAVGSSRYRISVESKGGHSFRDFGGENAIALLASLITRLDGQPLPEQGVTTYNFGQIEGGTTVNSIAQRASLLYEYRADRMANLAFMKRNFEQAIAELRSRIDGRLTVESLGERPCTGDLDESAQEALIRRIGKAFLAAGLPEPRRTLGSTDCNLPLSMGIPAVCIGLADGGGAHSTEEYLLPDSIPAGIEAVKHLLASYL
ncbi:MAG: M20/M25/M40 family metallo-hydrolase [Oscillospiraceae bacterium]|nr:M20/M25/M40 family metallo-hydrolase [Oscillospiraceae bacterium]